MGPSGVDALRGSDEDGNQFDIVTVPELIEYADARGGGGGSPIRLPEPRDLENDRLCLGDGMDIPPKVCAEGHESPQDSGEAIVVGPLPRLLRGSSQGGPRELRLTL